MRTCPWWHPSPGCPQASSPRAVEPPPPAPSPGQPQAQRQLIPNRIRSSPPAATARSSPQVPPSGRHAAFAQSFSPSSSPHSTRRPRGLVQANTRRPAPIPAPHLLGASRYLNILSAPPLPLPHSQPPGLRGPPRPCQHLRPAFHSCRRHRKNEQSYAPVRRFLVHGLPESPPALRPRLQHRHSSRPAPRGRGRCTSGRPRPLGVQGIRPQHAPHTPFLLATPLPHPHNVLL